MSEKDVVIPPNGQLMGMISELLPPESVGAVPPGFILGSLEIVFDHAVSVTALQFWPKDVGEAHSGEVGVAP